MRRIKYWDRELTVEEFVKIEICKNGGTQSVAFKEDLVSLCEAKGILCEKKKSKENLFDLLIENGCTHEELATCFGVGVSSQVYQSTFGISHNNVKRLEKYGVLKVVGQYRFRAFGKYNYAPLYDVYQYCRMTEDDVRRLQ